MQPEGPAVVVASGHMVDSPDRTEPRFPMSEVARVAREIAQQLRLWQVGPATTIICGGARGADIIIAEQACALGASLSLVLAGPVDGFVATSVELFGTWWTARFRELLNSAETIVIGEAGVGNRYAAANDAMIDLARSLAPEPAALLVWDGRSGDGPGGTADFLARFQAGPHGPIHTINPNSASSTC